MRSAGKPFKLRPYIISYKEMYIVSPFKINKPRLHVHVHTCTGLPVCIRSHLSMDNT